MKESNEYSLKASSFAALALAFASFGDAFLYPFLPVNSLEVGVPLASVGVLLSINRFIRIVSNSLIVHALAKYGLRTIMVIAVLLAITSTFGYGFATGVIAWIMFRIIWGLAFSAMRIGTIGYALQNQQPGLALGLSRGLQEAGPMVALFLAPVLLKNFEPRMIFYLLGCMSLPALYFAFKLPLRNDRTKAVEKKSFLQWPSTLNAITLVSAVVIDGIVVVVLGVLFLHYRNPVDLVTATALAAFYLGYRRLCLVVLSPAGGWMADRIGLERIFNLTMVMVILGLIIILSGWIAAGAVILFTFYSINAAITPGSVSKSESHSLVAVAENATWRDIGAATGTLVGGFLISSEHLTRILWIAIFVMATLVLMHILPGRGIYKLFSYGSNNNL
ncbi:MAG TPA: MFS transporter [Ohtaekwangia sp.]